MDCETGKTGDCETGDWENWDCETGKTGDCETGTGTVKLVTETGKTGDCETGTVKLGTGKTGL